VRTFACALVAEGPDHHRRMVPISLDQRSHVVHIPAQGRARTVFLVSSVRFVSL
jgi:hypothetical protein